MTPWSFSPDGRWLAYFRRGSDTASDIWTLPLDLSDPDHPRPGNPEVFVHTAAEEILPQFSPDAAWIAYRSDESGNSEIYVRPFPAGNGGKWQISSGGGLYAVWSKNGRELFYETADNRIMVVDYSVDRGSFIPGKPRLWSDRQLFYAGTSNLDLAPDGKRFAVLQMQEASQASPRVVFLLNFFDELRRRIPSSN
jgi:serine/threonine-protein kinase